MIPLDSSRISKEDIARKIQERDGVKEGLICVLKCVESCMSFDVRGNKENVMFKDRQSLVEIYPELLEHALVNFNASDVMAFLRRKLTGNFQGEIITDTKKRPQGVRMKHRILKYQKLPMSVIWRHYLLSHR